MAENRQHPRVKAVHLIHFTSFDPLDVPEKMGIGATLDLSVGGIKFWATESLPVGAVIDFEIAIADEILSPGGRIVHVCEVEEDRYIVGVEFTRICIFDMERIRAFVTGRAAVRGTI